DRLRASRCPSTPRWRPLGRSTRASPRQSRRRNPSVPSILARLPRRTAANDNKYASETRQERCMSMNRFIAVILLVGLGASTARAQSQPAQEPKPSMEIYGFAMLDMGHDFKQINPDWYDTLRVTKLPSAPNEFGKDNSTFAGVR